MSNNNERKFLATKNHEDPDYLQGSNRRTSPIPDITPTRTSKSDGNSLLKLDKKFADMKRKQMDLVSNGSPKGKPTKISNMLVNTSSNLPHTPVTHPTLINNDKNNTHLNELSNISSDISLSPPVRGLKMTRPSKADFTKSTFSSSILSSTGISRFIKGKIADILVPDTQIITNTDSSPVPTKKQKTNKFENILNPTIGDELSSLHESELHSETNSGRFADQLMSSPIKRSSTPRLRKTVAFSSDVESEPFTSSPIKGTTPKSILKISGTYGSSDKLLSLDELLRQDLTKNESWQIGVVLQIPFDHPNLTNILAALGTALSNKKFTKQYEVYATLNHLIKTQPRLLVSNNQFTKDVVSSIVQTVKINLTLLNKSLKSGSNAFKLRTSSQGLKLVSSLHQLTHNIPDIPFIYNIVIDLMQNEFISKGLTIAILQFIKVLPEYLYGKMEPISLALIQMRYFTSASIAAEKLNILKRFVVLQPTLLNSCGYQIFSYVLHSILNTDVPAYGKVLNSAIAILTCSARNNEAKMTVFTLLSECLEDSFSSLKSNAETGLKSWMTIGQALCETLKYLIHLQLYAQTAKTWSYLVYMSCFNRKGFMLEKWENYNYFVAVFRQLYATPGGNAFALEAWKSVVYNFQITSFKDYSVEKLKEKLNSLLLPFEEYDNTNQQWTTDSNYMILYCRIVYALRIQLEGCENEEHQGMLVDTMLKPLSNVTNIDDTTEFILKAIFSSTKYIYHEPADQCFWQSDLEKWKVRILPIPKAMFKNHFVFDVILQLVSQFFQKSLLLGTGFMNYCLQTSLGNMKLSSSQKEYKDAITKVADLIMKTISTFDFDNNGAEQYFGLIRDANSDLTYLRRNDGKFFLVNFLEKAKEFNDSAILDSVLTKSEDQFSSPKLFLLFLLTKNVICDFHLPLYDYDQDLVQILTDDGIDLNDEDNERIVDNLVKLITKPGEFPELYPKFVDTFTKSKLIDVLGPIFKLELFQRIMEAINTTSDISIFYSNTPDYMLEKILEIFNASNDDANHGQKFARFLLCFTDFKDMPSTWITLIGGKLTHLIHPELGFEPALFEFVYYILSKQSTNTLNKFKKIARKRNFADFAKSNPPREHSEKLIVDEMGSSFTDSNSASSDESNGVANNSVVTQTPTPGPTPEIEEDTILIESDSKETSDIVSIVIDDAVNGDPVCVNDMKSFIIDSMKSSTGKDDGNPRDDMNETTDCDNMSPSESSVLNDVHVSPAKRTRSRQQSVDDVSLDDWEVDRRRRKKDRRWEKRERREQRKQEKERSQSLESDIDASSTIDDFEADNDSEDDEDHVDSVRIETDLHNADLIQLRILLKRLNHADIKLGRETRYDLERDLVLMLAKLKQSDY